MNRFYIDSESSPINTEKKKKQKGKGKATAAAGRSAAKKALNKKRKRGDSDGPKYVRSKNASVLGEIATKDEEEMELEKTLFGDTEIVERLGGEIPKSEAALTPEALQDKLYEMEGVATSAVCPFILALF